MTESAALVLFSGGQDSTVCLAWALARYERVETIGFDYGQRHRVELEARTKILDRLRQAFPDWAGRLGPDRVLKLPALGEISETALTRDKEIEVSKTGLPSTFVPGRNLLFFTYAAALAWRRGSPRWSAACARPTTPGIPIAATKRCKRWPALSRWALTGPSE